MDHTFWITIRFVLGLGFLLAGGEYLVRGSVGIARSLKLSPMLIGIVVVGFGTSVPELLASLLSVIGKTYVPGIAIGNVIGSNIANILLIIGLSAAFRPLSKINVSNLDFIYLIASPFAFLVFLFLTKNNILFVGLSFIMTIAMIAYIVLSWKQEKQEKNEEHLSGLWNDPVFCFTVAFIAIFIMYFGARQMISEATLLSEKWSVKETVIGLSIIAVGTSLPELAASVIAAFHKESEISVGNIIGSNIFNILFIPGITGLAAAIKLKICHKELTVTCGPDIWEEFAFMVVVTIVFAILIKRGKINQLCGTLFCMTYLIYMFIIYYWK